MPKPHALVIEDDEELSELMADILQMKGLETEVIRDGQDAMNRLDGAVPDIILLDAHLPHVSGKDILNRIRAESRLSRIKVLVATADANVGATMGDKADVVFIKPITLTQLVDMVARLLPRMEV